MSVDPVQLGREVVGACLARGFALAGVAAAEASQRGEAFRAWLAEGKCGDMEYLRVDVPVRTDIRRLIPGCRSVVMVADRYGARGEAAEAREAGVGRIARYARGRDYHAAMKRRLHGVADGLRARFPGARFRAFVDTAPVMEREQAVRAGLGWIGKHTLLIHPRLGSWLLLGGIATTLHLEAEPGGGGPVADHCGACTRCIDACPTGAIAPYTVDARRCISYLTIERRGAIDPSLHAAMGDWIFGCDVCQEVCPHNGPAPAGGRGGRGSEGGVNAAYAPRRRGFDLLEVLGWTEADRRRAFATSAMKRATLGMMKRNAAIALANARRAAGGTGDSVD